VEPIDLKAAWAQWNKEADALAAEISAEWQGPQDAVAAVREQRDTYVYRNEPGWMSGDGS